MAEFPALLPAIGSFLLASTDPGRLRGWYERAFGVTADTDGFLRFGDIGLLVDSRDDVGPKAAEPARVILNLHVDDAQATARHLDAMGVTWLAPLEHREQAGAWFGTVLDPDGNYVQIIELTPAYWAARQQRARQAGQGLLAGAAVSGRLPAQDLERARRFYAEKLGLEPAETRPGGLRYQCRSGSFSIFQSSGRPSGEHTQLAWQVDDLGAVVGELRQRGVVFEEVNVRGLRTVNGIAEVIGNYPSAGSGGELAAWFYDSEGNLLGIGQAIPPPPQDGTSLARPVGITSFRQQGKRADVAGCGTSRGHGGEGSRWGWYGRAGLRGCAGSLRP